MATVSKPASRVGTFGAGAATGLLAAGVVLILGVLAIRGRRGDSSG